MNKKIIFIQFFLAHLLIFTFANTTLAQTIKTNPSPYCPKISQNLYLGIKDANTLPTGQVYELQKFLMDYYYWKPRYLSYGTFDKTTQRIIFGFQKENGIRQTGTVGALTREKILSYCKTSSTISVPSNPTTTETITPIIPIITPVVATTSTNISPTCSEREKLCMDTIPANYSKSLCTLAKNNCLLSCMNGAPGEFIGPASGKSFAVTGCR